MLKENLANLPAPTEIADIQDFELRLKKLNEAIQNAIKKHVKLMKPSPYPKRWWLTELTGEKKKMQQLGGRLKYHHCNVLHLVHEEY